MNFSTRRRLAADHASLHKSELPPYYLFPAADTLSSSADDFTQLNILLTGPQGTPYSQGLWKLSLKIPEDYPKSPPKAVFRTRIWHPNVEETTGSVCVDTLKRDWDPKLTLRDILITISCLLIQPNPDSALNATAGHLLRDDYESFARQAKLMTSIHARIPPNMKDAVLAAKRRGEPAGTVIKDELDENPGTKPKSPGSSILTMKKSKTLSMPLPQLPGNPCAVMDEQRAGQDDDSDVEVEDEASASKENDPPQFPSPRVVQVTRRAHMTKRPLSDLPTPTEDESNDEDPSGLSPSERNIAINALYSSSPLSTATDGSRQNLKLAERSRSLHFTNGGLQEASKDRLAVVPFDNNDNENDAAPATKRLCLWGGKENPTESQGLEIPTASAARPTVTSGVPGATKLAAGVTKKLASMSTVSGKGARPRVGLRRL